jgi:hypothetical protein
MCFYLYHYTNQAGVDGIKNCGRIKKSMANLKDAVHGDGVYLTDLDPSMSKSFISSKIFVNDITHVVKVGLEKNTWVTKKKDHIWLYEDKDLDLNDCFSYEIMEI